METECEQMEVRKMFGHGTSTNSDAYTAVNTDFCPQCLLPYLFAVHARVPVPFIAKFQLEQDFQR